ncbi:MAG: tetratricopeptide repeat protein, partial [Myxococcales bacterium]|nr:tetratricopeptide repeat protein [Myxococcales bacterium]
VYEQAARDIVEHPPLGTAPFYLQGAYAYLLALGMMIRPWPSFGLLVQLLLAGGALILFHRSMLRLWGRDAGRLCTIALLAHPGLMFYENKYLSAELGMIANIAVVAALVQLLRAWAARRLPADERGRWSPRPGLAALALGAASGLAILARPNLSLALPFAMAAAALLARASQDARRGRGALAAGLVLVGALLALAPMAHRNLMVTGHPDVQPIHGGGTSFFIGNNPKSKGLWNDGDLLSARLGTESSELAEQLEIDPDLDERDRVRAFGDALYDRALGWIGEHPGDFLRLELRKLWLTFGDQQLSQDYDWLGERELIPWAHRIGLSFSMILALGILGAGVIATRRWRADPAELVGRRADAPLLAADDPASRRALALVLAGLFLAPLAANLLFFTSAQHRLPLMLPAAVLAGPGALAAFAALRDRKRRGSWAPADVGPHSLPAWVWILAGLVLLQGPWSRSPQDHPHPVHYYNLAMVEDQIGEPRDALQSLDRAIALRPNQPIFHLRRAHLRLRMFDL